jgi:hypothetical protein
MKKNKTLYEKYPHLKKEDKEIFNECKEEDITIDAENYSLVGEMYESNLKPITTTNATEPQYVEMKYDNDEDKNVVIHTPFGIEYYAKQIKINIVSGKVIKIDYSNLQLATAYVIEKEEIIKYLKEAIKFMEVKDE